MPTNYVTIPRGEFRALMAEIKRGVEICDTVSNLRIKLQALVGRLDARIAKTTVKEITQSIELCENVMRLRAELSAFERRLREADQELTPVRPPSSADIKAAFDNSVEFARGEKKPKI